MRCEVANSLRSAVTIVVTVLLAFHMASGQDHYLPIDLAKRVHQFKFEASLLSPDGRFYVVAWHDGPLVCETLTGKPITKPAPISAPFTPPPIALSPDGTLLVAGGKDGNANLYDPVAGKPLGVTLEMRKISDPAGFNDIRTFDFDASGKHLLIANNEWIEMWDVHTHRLAGRPIRHPVGGQHTFRGAKISPDGTRILSFQDDQRAPVLWDAVKAKLLWDFEDSIGLPNDRALMAAVFSPDSRKVAIAEYWGGLQAACVCDVESGKLLFQTEKYSHGALSVAFNHDGTLLAVGATGAQVFDVVTGKPVTAMMAVDRFMGVATHVVFSPDSKLVVSAGPYGQGYVWDIASQKLILNVAEFQTMDFAGFTPDGKFLITGGDGLTDVWKVPPEK